MPPEDLDDLNPQFKTAIETVVSNCGRRGIEMRVYQTLRDPYAQAKLWRQSRTREEIDRKVQYFQDNGATFLAQCLESVGPQYGRPVTNAPPGLSWHQWGEAVDACWIVDGKAEWSTIRKVDGLNGYRVYAEEAKNLNLTPGGYWTSIRDWPHVQLQPYGSPLGVFTLEEIDLKMKEIFERSG